MVVHYFNSASFQLFYIISNIIRSFQFYVEYTNEAEIESQ
jgi:hypothetical protein